jgi:effector-binding domain-containing protein/uncharacterized membrane protein
MKIIKVILLTLVILVAILATIGFLSPSHVHVERSITINAPAEIVHAQINDLKNWTSWSPWYKMDTAMKIEYNTVASGAGASYTWKSDHKKVGNGDITITASTPDSISTAMNFMENGVAKGNFIFSKSDSGTKVTWAMDSDMGMNPIGRIFGLFMDKMLGPDFENGLASIKEVAEAIPTGPKTYRGYEVKEEDAAERVYIIKRDSVSWDSIETFCSKNFPTLFEAIGKAKLEITGPVTNLYFRWDSISKTAVMAVAVPVMGDAKTKVKGFETVVVPPGKNLHIVYMGGYSKIGNAHFAMDDYIKENNFLQSNPVIEEYVTGPEKEADSTKWITNVYYRVK